MKIYSKDGIEILEIYSLEKDGSDLIIRGRVMQSLKATMCIKPEELWKGKKLLRWSVMLYVPFILLKGFWLNLKSLRGNTNS